MFVLSHERFKHILYLTVHCWVHKVYSHWTEYVLRHIYAFKGLSMEWKVNTNYLAIYDISFQNDVYYYVYLAFWGFFFNQQIHLHFYIIMLVNSRGSLCRMGTFPSTVLKHFTSCVHPMHIPTAPITVMYKHKPYTNHRSWTVRALRRRGRASVLFS